MRVACPDGLHTVAVNRTITNTGVVSARRAATGASARCRSMDGPSFMVGYTWTRVGQWNYGREGADVRGHGWLPLAFACLTRVQLPTASVFFDWRRLPSKAMLPDASLKDWAAAVLWLTSSVQRNSVPCTGEKGTLIAEEGRGVLLGAHSWIHPCVVVPWVRSYATISGAE